MAAATLPVSDIPIATQSVALVTRMSMDEFVASKDSLERVLSQGHFIEVLRDGKVIAEVCVPGDTTPSRISAKAPFPDFLQRLRALWGETPMGSDITEVMSADRDAR